MYYRNNDKVFVLAIAFSLLAHITAILKLPNIDFDQAIKPETLVVEIAPEPKPVPPPKPEPLPEPPKPQLKPKPLQDTFIKPNPTTPPEVIPEPIITPPPVIAATPKPDVQPTFVTPPPPPEPPKPVVASPDNDAIRAQYIRSIGPELAKNKHYPKMAMMRGWTGITKLEIQLDINGKLLSSEVKESSGYDLLDKQALELVRKTVFPAPPEAIIGRSITIPISFDLKTE